MSEYILRFFNSATPQTRDDGFDLAWDAQLDELVEEDILGLRVEGEEDS